MRSVGAADEHEMSKLAIMSDEMYDTKRMKEKAKGKERGSQKEEYSHVVGPISARGGNWGSDRLPAFLPAHHTTRAI